MAVACLAMIVSLFLPWYSVYNEIEEVNQEPATETVADDSLALSDSAQMALLEMDSITGVAMEAEGTGEEPMATVDEAEAGSGPPEANVVSQSAAEEVIHGYVARKKIYKEYERVSAVGSFALLGSAGSLLFSSGIGLIVVGVIFLIYMLACIASPVYTLYGLFGLKGDADNKALRLKRLLRLNWVPLLLFVVAVFLSFVGADYSFDPAQYYASLGDSFGPGAFFNSMSWGVFVSLGASIMLAVKGIEI
jgi:hypothetical protein